MNMTKLDEQDERNFGATRKAEMRIVREWLIASLVTYVLGISAGTIVAYTLKSQMNLWLGLFIIAIVSLLVLVSYKLITKAITETHAEFRKLEGFISISTLTLVESIERENNVPRMESLRNTKEEQAQQSVTAGLYGRKGTKESQ